MRGESLEYRFWSKVSVGDWHPDGCWEWMAATTRGYGLLGRAGGRSAGTMIAHRLSWEIHNGKIPNGLHVLHRCDNPLCVNPDHLFLGTQSDNMQDMIRKGRHGNTMKTHCIRGHEFTDENTYHHRSGSRRCRLCRRKNRSQ